MRKTAAMLAGAMLVLALSAPLARADYVTGLNPSGDNYLALRSGPGKSHAMIRKLPPDTIVEVLGADGVWRKVRLADGTIGWAHSAWLAPGLPPGASAADEPADRTGGGDVSVQADWTTFRGRHGPIVFDYPRGLLGPAAETDAGAVTVMSADPLFFVAARLDFVPPGQPLPEYALADSRTVFTAEEPLDLRATADSVEIAGLHDGLATRLVYRAVAADRIARLLVQHARPDQAELQAVAGQIAASFRTEAPLAPDSDTVAGADGWATYRNARFGTIVDYPAGIFAALPPPENGDGQSFEADGGAVFLIVFATHNMFEKTLEELMADDVALGGYDEVTYRRTGDGWYVLSGFIAGDVFYRKAILTDGGALQHVFEITYPARDKARFDPIVARMAKSFRAGAGAARAPQPEAPVSVATAAEPAEVKAMRRSIGAEIERLAEVLAR